MEHVGKANAMRGVHGEKIIAAMRSARLPESDRARLEEAILKYDQWIVALETVDAPSVERTIEEMVKLLNEYKFYVDVDLIFDSPESFLYRQKGQLKLDNTVVEEFLPLLVRKCLINQFGECAVDIGSQVPVFSSAYFASTLANSSVGGGFRVKTKDQDFSMGRAVYLGSSDDGVFDSGHGVVHRVHLGYVMAEVKTNLDKTMFQEACATAHDIMQTMPGAKYYLLCDFLDMAPISTKTTDIDEILITRKAKRIGTGIRQRFTTSEGRQENREAYVEYLREHPYSTEVFERFVEHIFSLLNSDALNEENILQRGYF